MTDKMIKSSECRVKNLVKCQSAIGQKDASESLTQKKIQALKTRVQNPKSGIQGDTSKTQKKMTR